MKLLRHVPNTLTLLNLILGTIAVIAMANAQVTAALILIGLCLMADILDGAIARKLGISSELGIQLDSLADVVSFGVLPSMMLFFMGSRYGGEFPTQPMVAVIASLNAASAGFRLARFNVDVRPREYFWGLATPAGGMLVAGWLWAQYIDRDLGLGVADHPWLIILVTVFLVIAYHLPLRLPGLKSPKSGLMIAAALALLVVVGFFTIGPISIPLGIVSYYLIGLVNHVVKFY